MIDFKNGSIIKLNVTNETGPAQDIQPLLVKNETIIRTYKSVRDYVMFTNKRIIAVNVQEITGKKKDFTSLPYSRIQVFSIETSGHFDLDSELELYISSIGKIKFEFVGNCNIADIAKIISTFVL